MKSVIVLEFNELAPHLVDRFLGEGVLPNFKRLRDESIVAVTDAEEQPPALNPWIQWVTVHTGKSYAEHGVFHLSDGPNYQGKRIWDMVSDAGKPVWVCGSMNSAIAGGINGAVLPDPWSVGVQPYPENLSGFHNLVSRFVKNHESEKMPVAHADILRFGRFMAANGLSLATIGSAVAQLTTERRGGTQWARAFILDRLQRDLFKHQYQKLKPAFATLFSNSTAHLQHFHWRNMEPEKFSLQPSEREQQRFANAIREGYVRMDNAIGEIFELADPETSIVLCTALSQQAMTLHDDDGGKRLFKVKSHEAFAAFTGIDMPHDYEPVMSHKFHLAFESEVDAANGAERIEALRIDGGVPLMKVEIAERKLVLVCGINSFPPKGTRISSRHHNRTLDFEELFYPLETVRSGMHHPDGIFWVRTPSRRHMRVERKVSLREVAPTLLYLSGVAAPAGAFAFPPMPEVRENEEPLRAAA